MRLPRCFCCVNHCFSAENDVKPPHQKSASCAFDTFFSLRRRLFPRTSSQLNPRACNHNSVVVNGRERIVGEPSGLSVTTSSPRVPNGGFFISLLGSPTMRSRPLTMTELWLQARGLCWEDVRGKRRRRRKRKVSKAQLSFFDEVA